MRKFGEKDFAQKKSENFAKVNTFLLSPYRLPFLFLPSPFPFPPVSLSSRFPFLLSPFSNLNPLPFPFTLFFPTFTPLVSFLYTTRFPSSEQYTYVKLFLHRAQQGWFCYISFHRFVHAAVFFKRRIISNLGFVHAADFLRSKIFPRCRSVQNIFF